MKNERNKRLAWFAVFMIWLGMVSSILVYQSTHEGLTPTQGGQGEKIIEVNNEPVVIEKMPKYDDREQQGQESEQNTSNNVQLSKIQEENTGDDFFVQYRLNRDKSRQERISNLREMVNNPNSDPSVKKSSQETILYLTKKMEQEMEIEGLIRARGYKEAVAMLHDSSIDLIIQTEGLTDTDVAKIGDIVTRITDLRVEDITIIEKRFTKR